MKNMQSPSKPELDSMPPPMPRRWSIKHAVMASSSRGSISLVFVIVFLSSALYMLSIKNGSFNLNANNLELDLTDEHVSSSKNPSVFNETNPKMGPKLNSMLLQPGFSELIDTPYYDAGTITVIIPMTANSVKNFKKLLQPLLSEHSSVSALTMICTPEILNLIDDMVQDENLDSALDISVVVRRDEENEGPTAVNAARQSLTEYALIMDEDSLIGLHEETRLNLLSHLLTDTPMGYCGGKIKHQTAVSTCILPSTEPQTASFLLPPFIIPTALLRGINVSSDQDHIFWEVLGRNLIHSDGTGSLVQESHHGMDRVWCYAKCQKSSIMTNDSFLGQCEAENASSNVDRRIRPEFSSSIAVILPNLNDLNKFSTVICRFIQSGYNVHVLTLSHDLDHVPSNDGSFPWLYEQLTSDICKLPYSVLHTSSNNFANIEAIDFWIKSANESMSVIISATDHTLHYAHDPSSAVIRSYSTSGTVVIEIPQRDLSYCDWIGSLTLPELRKWNIPSVDISVITDNRPKSLGRLLDSLQKARYFGDQLNLRINIEQTADTQTRRLVDTFIWEHGRTFVHHRVVHAGLLTAIVESWFPATNDSYGVLLEDDVEVSPLFYAWIKLCLLRYRYGSNELQMASLFGISLYQQKQIELRPEGRRPFDAQLIFDTFGLLYRNSPYLSQIPCSWGAVYFPEHWREFHKYLMVRFSEAWVPLYEPIVPHVRSNRWSKSWKRFFIELVYLRGYVMLYPNYDDFVSFSTNHLEIGSHVKEQPRSIYDKKKALFELPLMPLPGDQNFGDKDLQKDVGALTTGLLDLPGSQLPAWEDLPVLDLLGGLTSKAEIIERGKRRQSQLVGCITFGSQDEDDFAQTFKVEELFTCLVDKYELEGVREADEIDNILIHDDM